MTVSDILLKLLRFPVKAVFPFTVRRSDIRWVPNRYGMLFLIVLLAMLVGSINYNNNFGFLLTFLLGGMMVISVFYSYRNLAGVTLQSWNAKPVFAGDDAVFEVLARSGHAARNGLRCSFHKLPFIEIDMAENSEIRLQLSASTQVRGVFKPGPLMISSVYPLGLFNLFILLDADMTTVVYPKPISGELLPVIASITADHDTGSEGGIGSDDFMGLRGYQPGDPVRRIAWKAYSRGQGLQTKEFTAAIGSTLYLDWNSLHDPDPEIKISRLCDMVLKAHAMRFDYGLNLPGNEIIPDKGDAHKHRCLKALALFIKD